MARRLIGLDIGTNAVTVAEVRRANRRASTCSRQVALPRETMREGEVADDAAVTDAVARLRTEVGLKKVAVRLGTREPAGRRPPDRDAGDVARGALERAAVPGRRAHPDPARRRGARLRDPRAAPTRATAASRRMHVLLAAVQEATVLRLVSAVEAGGLQVAAVDLVPLALIRSLARSARECAGRCLGRRADGGRSDSGGVALAEASGRRGHRLVRRWRHRHRRARGRRAALRARARHAADASSPTRSRASSICRRKPRRR